LREAQAEWEEKAAGHAGAVAAMQEEQTRLQDALEAAEAARQEAIDEAAAPRNPDAGAGEAANEAALLERIAELEGELALANDAVQAARQGEHAPSLLQQSHESEDRSQLDKAKQAAFD